MTIEEIRAKLREPGFVSGLGLMNGMADDEMIARACRALGVEVPQPEPEPEPQPDPVP